jgi:hypothetical protein
MLQLDFLGVLCVWKMQIGFQLLYGGALRIGRGRGETAEIGQGLLLQQGLVFPALKAIRPHNCRTVLRGMPWPALAGFLTNKTPHLLPLRFASMLDIHGDIGYNSEPSQR